MSSKGIHTRQNNPDRIRTAPRKRPGCPIDLGGNRRWPMSRRGPFNPFPSSGLPIEAIDRRRPTLRFQINGTAYPLPRIPWGGSPNMIHFPGKEFQGKGIARSPALQRCNRGTQRKGFIRREQNIYCLYGPAVRSCKLWLPRELIPVHNTATSFSALPGSLPRNWERGRKYSCGAEQNDCRPEMVKG